MTEMLVNIRVYLALNFSQLNIIKYFLIYCPSARFPLFGDVPPVAENLLTPSPQNPSVDFPTTSPKVHCPQLNKNFDVITQYKFRLPVNITF